MPKRDWQKDLELCLRAKEKAVEISQNPSLLIEIPTEYRLGVWLHHLGFLEEALEGWLAALEERARLEEQVRELEQQVQELRKQLQEEEWFHKDREEAAADYIKELEQRVRTLEEKLAEAIEALKEIMDDTEDCTPYIPREHLWRVIKSNYVTAKIALQDLG